MNSGKNYMSNFSYTIVVVLLNQTKNFFKMKSDT